MTPPRIRLMTTTDVPKATRALFEDNWGNRRLWFEFATTQPACRAVVAEVDGRIVGTGVGTVNGAVGWIGTIWVAPASRSAGLGRALTGAVIDALEGAGCRTLVLVATDEGLPLYERMGFEHEARYQILEISGLAGEPRSPVGAGAGDGVPASGSGENKPGLWLGHVTAFAPGDVPHLIRLDRSATNEDRAHAITRFATPTARRSCESRARSSRS